MKPDIILVGGGGHCKSCIDVIEAENKYTIKGIIDLPSKINDEILGYPVIGNDDDIVRLSKENNTFLITLGNLGNSSRRNELYNLIKEHGGNLAIIKSPYSIVSKKSVIMEGTIVMHNAIINTNSSIGYNCIINNMALVEHDAIIGNNCHISTNATINGECQISDNVFIGSSATIKNGIKIIDNVIVGIGAVVTKSISQRGTYIGVPAKNMNNE